MTAREKMLWGAWSVMGGALMLVTLGLWSAAVLSVLVTWAVSTVMILVIT